MTVNRVFIPLEGKVFMVIVLQVSGHRHFTTNTDFSFGSSNRNNRSLHHIDLERITHRTATILSGNLDLHDVRVRTFVEVFTEDEGITKSIDSIVSDLTRFVPSVVQRTNNSR